LKPWLLRQISVVAHVTSLAAATISMHHGLTHGRESDSLRVELEVSIRAETFPPHLWIHGLRRHLHVLTLAHATVPHIPHVCSAHVAPHITSHVRSSFVSSPHVYTTIAPHITATHVAAAHVAAAHVVVSHVHSTHVVRATSVATTHIRSSMPHISMSHVMLPKIHAALVSDTAHVTHVSRITSAHVTAVTSHVVVSLIVCAIATVSAQVTTQLSRYPVAATTGDTGGLVRMTRPRSVRMSSVRVWRWLLPVGPASFPTVRRKWLHHRPTGEPSWHVGGLGGRVATAALSRAWCIHRRQLVVKLGKRRLEVQRVDTLGHGDHGQRHLPRPRVASLRHFWRFPSRNACTVQRGLTAGILGRLVELGRPLLERALRIWLRKFRNVTVTIRNNLLLLLLLRLLLLVVRLVFLPLLVLLWW